MVPEWQNGLVTRIEQETYNTRRYWIRFTETDSFTFKAGQFVTLDLPISEHKNKRWRSYSIASMPTGSNEIELLISHIENGAGSTYIFNEIKEGSSLVVRGPQGVFTLPAQIDRDIYFICTGTGIAPFRSMLCYIHKHQLPHENLYLVFGCRTRNDLLYVQDMHLLEKSIPGFTYYPTLSREDWDGRKGYVHAIYEELCAAGHYPAYFMLCGWRAMIDEAKERIITMGYDKKDIHSELYG